MRSSTCEVDEEQSAPRPVLGRAGDAGPGGGEAAEACAGCRFEGEDARGEEDVSRGEVVAEEGEELCVGTRSGQRATEAARTTPLAGEGGLVGESGCEVFCGEDGGEAVAPIAVARPSLERCDSLSQSSGETAGCGSAVATWLGSGSRMRVRVRVRARVRVKVRVKGRGRGRDRGRGRLGSGVGLVWPPPRGARAA